MQITAMLKHGLSIHGLKFNNLEFADDIDLLEEILERLQENLELVTQEAMHYDLNINTGKTKIMVFGDDTPIVPLKINNEEIETANQFIYLGSFITSDNDCSAKIKRQIGITSGALDNLQKIWNSLNINLTLKVLQTCVFRTFVYTLKIWTLKKVDINKIIASELRCK